MKMMTGYARSLFSLRRLPAALVVLAGLSAGTWLISRPAPAESTNLIDSSLAGRFSRTGATTDQAIQSLQEHLRALPEDWSTYSALGLAYLQKARETGDPAYYEKSEQAFQKTLAENPGDYAAAAGMGSLALARHQFQAALEWGQRARTLNPYRTDAHGIIADAQIELGRYDEAVATLQEMVDLYPDMRSYARVSYIRELYGRVDLAVEAMQMAADAGEPHLENTAWTRTQLGNLYFNLGDLERAEQEYRRTMQGYPDYIYAQAGLGRVRAAQGDTEEAISWLTTASRAVPLPEFVIALADVYQQAGQFEAARRQHNLLLTIQKLYQAGGVDLDLEMALFNADHGYDPARTLEQARQAYARRPSIYAADVLAWCLYQAGQYTEAQQYARQALRLGSQDALKLYHAGMISLRLGNRQEARQYLEQALAINPHFSILYSHQAQAALDELRSAVAR